MSSEIKYVVSELSKEPYNKNYNLISFDSLTPEQLLQVLNDVFTEIDQKNSVDIREEDPNQMAMRMLGMLKILKYKPPDELKHDFRAGLVAGHKFVIQPILYWLLSKMDDLKKRAYLAKYLVKVDVPTEILAATDVSNFYYKVEEMIVQFKEIHKEYEAIKMSGFSTSELRRDIAMMEEERDLVTRRIERMKQKTESVPNYDALLDSVKLLRQEKERQKEMSQQEYEIKNVIKITEQRNSRLDKQLKDLRKASVGASPEGLMKKLEEEVNVNNYIVMEKMPKELKNKEKAIEVLKKVSSEPSLGQEEMDTLNRNILNLTNEINNLNKEKIKELDDDEAIEGTVGKLSFFRQNAAIVNRKKEQTAEKLNEMRNEIHSLEEDIKEKIEQLEEYSGEEVLRGEDFKVYINQLRGKSSTYKIKKAELSELRAELGVLSRTKEILQAQYSQIDEQLSVIENQAGIPGFRSAQENLEDISNKKSEIDEKKGEALEEMSQLVRELNLKIAEKKTRLAPLLKEIKPLREKFQQMTTEYNQKKKEFDSTATGLESSMTKLQQEVQNQYDEMRRMETKYHYTLAEKEILSFKLEKASEEIKLYLSKDSQDKKKSMRDQLMGLISEEEKQSWLLREEQKNAKELVQTSAKQLAMWKDIIKLMEAKNEYVNRMSSQEVIRNGGTDTLVI